MDREQERHVRAKHLFQQALECDTAARDALLRKACADDPGLLAEVRGLLQAHFEAPTDFLEGDRTFVEDAVDPAGLGRERGWRVLRPLGRGGMGVVYLAERADGAYDQQVALKLLDPSVVPDRGAVQRLQLERRILAQLNHPWIARLLDGGTAANGAPYLVMEYVSGERLDRWCRRQQLDLRGRVALFQKVCAAVAYAHRNLVVHRDLKPDNILVTAEGEPKLLDFGIARLLAEDSGLTQEAGQRLTPRYASPEQIRGTPVGPRSDLYSLGVILFELLVGESPYADAVSSPHRLPQAITDADAGRPSARLQRLAQADPALAGARLREARALRGDLDAIVLKCLRKEPEARYESVEALVADLQAWQEQRPVAAHRGGQLYRWRKFARRHWLALLSAAGVLALSAAFVLQLAGQLEQTRLERDKNARTLAFVTDLFRVADPSEARGSSVTVREALDRGAELLQQDAGLEPAVRQSLTLTIAAVYRQLGLLSRAEPMLEGALEQSRDAPGRVRAPVAILLAALRSDQGRYDDALSLLEQADAALDSDPDAAPELRSRERYQRGELALRQGRFAEAEGPLNEALALRQRIHGEPSREVAEVLTALGSIERDRGEFERAQANYQRALGMLEALHTDPWSRAKLSNNLAVVAGDRGDFAEAERRMREALALIRAAVGEDHALTAVGLGNVGSMLGRRGAHDEAEPLLRRALEIRRAQLGPDHPLTGTAQSNIGFTLFALGRWDEAEAELRQALAIQQAGFGPAHLHGVATMRNLAALAYARGDLDAAGDWNQRQLDQAGAALGPEHPLLLQARARLAFLQCVGSGCDLGTLRSAVQAHVAKLGAQHPEAGESLAALALAERLHGDAAACDSARRAQQALLPQVGAGHWDSQWAGLVLAECDGAAVMPMQQALEQRYGVSHPALARWRARPDASHAP